MEKDNSLTNKAYETIRQQIFDFDLFPGQIVSDYLLSKELNMSRTPIRQALMRLKNEGLLEEQIGKKNYRVSTITKEDIQDLFDFREGIETTAFMWRVIDRRNARERSTSCIPLSSWKTFRKSPIR